MSFDTQDSKIIDRLEHVICSNIGEDLFSIDILHAIVDTETDALVFPTEEMVDNAIFKALANYPSRLRGHHIQFIREHMMFSRYNLCYKLDCLPSDIAYWETSGSVIPKNNYTWLHEFTLRLCADALWVDGGAKGVVEKLWRLLDDVRQNGQGHYSRIVIDTNESGVCSL